MRAALTIAAVSWLLTTWESVLRPFATALLLAVLLSATSERLVRLVPSTWRRGKIVARLVSIVGVGGIFFGVAVLVAEAIAQLTNNVNIYTQNIDYLLAELQKRFGGERELTVLGLARELDVRSIAIQFAASMAAFGSIFFVVILYLVFIFAETSSVGPKIAALARDEAEEKRLRGITRDIKRGIDDVIAVQVFVGAFQAVPTFIVLTVMGVDAAALWAVFVFFFSFIPTIGTVFGIAIPSLMTLLQFMELQPFVIVLALTGAVQLYGTNILMPRMMSKSLNVSSLAVLIAVFAGGALWGIIGAIIAVPVLTITLIVCAKVPSLRAVAVLISANGALPDDPPPRPSGADAERASDF